MALGTFHVEAEVFMVGSKGPRVRVSLVADTGATYTTLPATTLKKLGVHAERKMRVRLADGSVVERGFGYVGLSLPLERRRLPLTPVVFGDEEIYLLGAVTLEELSLAADPVHKKLIPAEGLLLAFTGR